MRVDLGNLTEITKKSAAVQNKGTQAVLNENITTKETDKTGHSYTVKSVTYETLLAEDKKSAEDIAMQARLTHRQCTTRWQFLRIRLQKKTMKKWKKTDIP